MAGLLPLEEAQTRLIAMSECMGSETVKLEEALGCYLAEDLIANRAQPAADMSAMDGYAIRFEDREGPWRLIGECKAGSPPCRKLEAGETARIFTGSLLPAGADTVVMQENVATENDIIRLVSDASPAPGRHVRHKASDFDKGDIGLTAGTRLDARSLGHAVIAGHDDIPIGVRPHVAIISTGDELVAPGQSTQAHQIPASNDVMISAMLAPLPCVSRNISRIADNMDAVCAAFEKASGSDIIVTIGGASVGDHDLIAPALQKLGGEIDFWKIAMKPGKPLMAGRLGSSLIVALPGNPGSAFVTATLFLLPLIKHMAGAADYLPSYKTAQTKTDLPPVQNRAQFLRAIIEGENIQIFDSQDSAKLSVLARANALLYRPAHAPACPIGSPVPYIGL